jgi:hypothetical protein
MFGNKLNRSKLYLGRNEEQVEDGEFLQLLGAGFFVFQFAIQKYKY